MSIENQIAINSPKKKKLSGQKPIKLALVSCGLGHINRGVEVSTARWYEALKNNENLDVRLFSGGEYPDATKIDNIPRDLLLKTIGLPFTYFNGRRTWEFAYGTEQMTFAAGFGSTLLSWQPDVVWTKETPFAHVLAFTRPMFNLKYKLIFSNGCGFKPATYAHFDYIQHLHQESFEDAKRYGIPPERMTVLPNLVRIPKLDKTKETCRDKFGYKPDDWVITCAAAWNCYHKRIDYLIEEVAKIKDERVKLLLCGQPETDTHYLKKLAHDLLPNRVQWHTLPSDQVPTALKAADIFVLPSLEELFGGVVVEAMMLGIPVVTHKTSANRQFTSFNLPNYDLSTTGSLAKHLLAIKNSPLDEKQLADLAKTMQKLYSEDSLCQQFADMASSALINADTISRK
jgi:1,2-diacylglycerol 3-alpha-glucosyltransferase